VMHNRQPPAVRRDLRSGLVPPRVRVRLFSDWAGNSPGECALSCRCLSVMPAPPSGAVERNLGMIRDGWGRHIDVRN
jgi:hypothetical protein